MDSGWEVAVSHRVPSLVLCDDLERWDGGKEGDSRGRGYMYNYDWFPHSPVGKLSACNAGDLGLIPWKRKWQLTAVFLPGESHGQRSLPAYSLWGSKSRTQLSDETTTAPTVLLYGRNEHSIIQIFFKRCPSIPSLFFQVINRCCFSLQAILYVCVRWWYDFSPLNLKCIERYMIF